MNWRLKEAIAKKFGTQYDFAQTLRRHETDISRIVRGRRTLTEADKQKWAELLEVDESFLFQ